MSTDVYVGNLSLSTTEDALIAAFAAAGGSVKNVVILRNQQTGRSRGFGFVRMGSESEAVAAIQAMNGIEVGGQPLRVGASHERPRPGRTTGRRLDDDSGYGGTRSFGGKRRSSGGGSRRKRG